MSPRLVLVGPPGAGKSTVGSALAEALGERFVDTDVVVADGRDVTEAFVDLGEAEFRRRERAAVAAALAAGGVVAVGAGAVEDPATRAALRGLPVVFLDVSVAAGFQRSGLNVPRPVTVASPRPVYRSLAAERRPRYLECARWTVDTSDLGVTEVLARVRAVAGL